MQPFSIQTSSDTPIYRQLIDQVHRLAASGRLSPGERLPSVRQVAESLAINPMTVSKAYNQLEQDGLLERRRGIGMVVKEDARSTAELLGPALTSLVDQAKQLRVDRQTLISMIDTQWDQSSKEET